MMQRRLRDWIFYLLSRLGWAGVAGLLAVAGALAMQFLVTQTLQRDTDRLVREAARLASQPVPPPVLSSDQRLALRLSLGADTPASLGQLFEAADATGLSLDEGEYKLTGGQGGDPRRYQITLPMVGSYPALRDFIGRALNDNPTLALDGLRLSRESIEASELEATLRFTLYLGEAQR